MNIPKYARYEYCNRRACEFLEEFGITTFPIEVEAIILQNKWGLVKYSELMNSFSCDLNTVIKCLGSNDGYTQFDGYNYTIAYNDSSELGNRKRFTLMHEVGHIYLGHLKDFESTLLYRGSLTKSEYKVLENEANAFARNVLAPTSLIAHLKNKSKNSIAEHFGLTPKAASTRISFYYKDLQINQATNITKRLYYIFSNFYYKRKCKICNVSLTQKDPYCPICGSNNLLWGDGKMRYPVKIILNQNSKALRCPICDNEDVPIDGEYCPICGTMLVNKCTNVDEYGNGCGNFAAGNARYCIYCGAPTTFLQNKILEPWKNYEFTENSSSDSFLSIPDVVDEELPFY